MTFNTRLSVVAVILALVIIVGFVLSVPHTREVREATIGAKGEASTTPPVSLKDTYKKGIHTLSGSVTAPDACASVSASATLASSSGQVIMLDISMPPSTGMCLMAPTAFSFQTTVAARSNTPVAVRVNGALATTTP